MSLLQRLLKRNVGNVDRMIRMIPMAAFIAVWFTGLLSGPALVILGVVSFMLLLTAITARCSIYAMFGLNTCSKSIS